MPKIEKFKYDILSVFQTMCHPDFEIYAEFWCKKCNKNRIEYNYVKSRFFPLFADESVLTTFPACFHVLRFGILNEKSRS